MGSRPRATGPGKRAPVQLGCRSEREGVGRRLWGLAHFERCVSVACKPCNRPQRLRSGRPAHLGVCGAWTVRACLGVQCEVFDARKVAASLSPGRDSAVYLLRARKCNCLRQAVRIGRKMHIEACYARARAAKPQPGISPYRRLRRQVSNRLRKRCKLAGCRLACYTPFVSVTSDCTLTPGPRDLPSLCLVRQPGRNIRRRLPATACVRGRLQTSHAGRHYTHGAHDYSQAQCHASQPQNQPCRVHSTPTADGR